MTKANKIDFHFYSTGNAAPVSSASIRYFRNDSPSPEECLVQETIKQTKVINPVSQQKKQVILNSS